MCSKPKIVQADPEADAKAAADNAALATNKKKAQRNLFNSNTMLGGLLSKTVADKTTTLGGG